MTDQASKRLYDRNFALAVASQTFFVIANTLMAHYARWIEFLGGDLQQVGFIMGFSALLGLALRPWMAQWMNRLGARNMWAVGYAVFAAAAVCNLLLTSLSVWIYLFRGGLVLGAAIVFASSLTYVSQIAPDSRRAEAIGVLGVGGFLGMLIGPYLGDVFLGGVDRTWNNFAVFFSAAAMANVIPAAVLWFIRPSDSPDRSASVQMGDFFTTVRRHWPGSILLIDLAFGVCMTAPFVFVASFIDHEKLAIYSLSTIGVFFWFYAGPAILVRIVGRRLPELFGDHKILIIGGLFMGIGMFGYTLVDAQRAWMIVVPATLTGLGHGLMFHTMTSLTLVNFPNSVRGSGSALALMMLDLGAIAGAPILGYIGECYGFATLFSSIGAFTLVALGIYAISLNAKPDLP